MDKILEDVKNFKVNIHLVRDLGNKNKLTKKESGYIPPFPSIRCATCAFYSQYKCTIVSGYISPDACCNLWTFSGILNTDFICGQDIEDILSDKK